MAKLVNLTPSIEDMVVELKRAGWEEKTSYIWRAPNGTLHVGPAGAWRLMKRQPRTVDEERQRILKNALRVRVEIEQTFTDIASWNENARKPDEDPIDADPDGDMRRIADGIDRMLEHEIACGGKGPLAPVLTPQERDAVRKRRAGKDT